MWFEAGDDGADDGAIGMYFSRDVHNRGIRESGIDIRASSWTVYVNLGFFILRFCPVTGRSGGGADRPGIEDV